VNAEPGIYPSLEDAEYRAIPAIAHSDLRRWAAGEDRKETRALIVGQAFHCVLTLPEHAARTFATMPDEVDLRTAEGKAALADFEDRTGKRALRPSERQVVKNMVSAVREHPEASKFLNAPGDVELAVVSDLGFGPLSKGLIDKRCRKCLVDFKSTGHMDEAEFLNSIYEFGYDSQGAYYTDLVQKHLGEFLPLFFVCASKRSYKAWVVRLTPEQYVTGRRWYRDVLRLYAAHGGVTHAA
jgi:hypothetical protein